MRSNRLYPFLMTLAASAGFAPSAHALLLGGAAVNFSGSSSLTDQEGGGATSAAGSQGSTALARFDPSVGVLTGATLKLNSTRIQSIQVTSTAAPASGNNDVVTSNGSATSVATLNTPAGASTLGALAAGASCTGNRKGSCAGPVITSNTATDATLLMSPALLDAFVGGGTVDVVRSVALAVTQASNKFTGVESTSYSLAWSGSLAMDYEYLLHAAPSFDANSEMLELDLDFGKLAVGDAGILGFSLYNRSGERAGLDLDSISGSGDTAVLGLGLGPFMEQGSGSHSDWLALLDTANAGVFSATYLLTLSDADVGAEASRFGYGMRIRLHGEVADPIVALAAQASDLRAPEPDSLSLGACSLLVLAGLRRRVAMDA